MPGFETVSVYSLVWSGVATEPVAWIRLFVYVPTSVTSPKGIAMPLGGVRVALSGKASD
jgi:hypothetical protein